MNRVAVVTGAARGIGAATVLALAERDYRVVAVDRCANDRRLPYPLGTEEQLHEVMRLAGADRVLPVVADVCDEEALAGAVLRAEERFGGLDAFLAVAGVVAGGEPLWEMPKDRLDAVLDVDLYGVITAARVAVPALLRRPRPRSGRFVAVASAASTRGLPGLTAYCAAKAGVAGMVRALAMDLRGTGVTASAVSPGSTDTDVLAESARLYGLASPDEFAARQPVERLLEPAEVAEALAWLAEPASSAVTGANVAVDGGLAL